MTACSISYTQCLLCRGKHCFLYQGEEVTNEEEEAGVSIASLTHGAPAHKCGKILISDKILEVRITE